MKLWQRTIGTVLAGMGLAVAGCKEPPPRVEPPPPRVTVGQPEVRQVTDVDQYNGWVDATATVEVRSRVRGHIDKVHFRDGQMVQRGEVLFQLDPRTYEAEVRRARDQGDVYRAQLVAAQKEELRLREMLTRGGASQRQVERAEADVRSLQAQIEANEQEIARRVLDVEFTRITAPISGRIGRAMLTEGNLVNAGGSDPLLATIVSVDPVNVYFNVDERAIQRYQRQLADGTMPGGGGGPGGAKLSLMFARDTDRGFPFKATLDFTDIAVDRSTGTLLVRAVAENPDRILVPGSRVRIRIPTSAERPVTLVPATAILSDQDRRYVLVLDEKNVVQRRDVRLGRLLDDGARVILPHETAAPLTSSDRIVVQGLQSARLNYPVEPVMPATRPAGSGSGAVSGVSASSGR